MTAPKVESRPVREGSGEMFDAIAPRYDLLNRVLSVGIDVGWRKAAARSLGLRPGARVLDVATGTGELAIEIARHAAGSAVVGVDPSRGMLQVAARKIAAAGLTAEIELHVGSAERLPFDDATFDAVTIAFGIRNVVDRRGALVEMCRVARPGAALAVLELSEPEGGGASAIARLWVHKAVPWIGGVLSGSREYGYLQRSIAAFPPADKFAALVRDAGWQMVRIQPLTFGAAHLFVARRTG